MLAMENMGQILRALDYLNITQMVNNQLLVDKERSESMGKWQLLYKEKKILFHTNNHLFMPSCHQAPICSSFLSRHHWVSAWAPLVAFYVPGSYCLCTLNVLPRQFF